MTSICDLSYGTVSFTNLVSLLFFFKYIMVGGRSHEGSWQVIQGLSGSPGLGKSPEALAGHLGEWETVLGERQTDAM